MRQVAPFLSDASRGLAICAVLAGVGAGLLEAVFGATYICVDSCGRRDLYFASLGPTAVRVMTPCVVLEVLALAAFLIYCLATRQAQRAAISLLFLLVGDLVGAAALSALMQHGQATLPVGDGGFLIEGPAEAWAAQWGLALTLVAGAWSRVLAYLQWRR